MQEPSLATVIIAAGVAWTGIVLFVVCAIARRDESCDPERDCQNCGRFNNDKPVPPECCECIKAFPLAPNWKPINRRDRT